MTASLPGPVDSTEAIRLALRSWLDVPGEGAELSTQSP